MPSEGKFLVTVETEGGCVTHVALRDAESNEVPFELNIIDWDDEPDDMPEEEGYRAVGYVPPDGHRLLGEEPTLEQAVIRLERWVEEGRVTGGHVEEYVEEIGWVVAQDEEVGL
jgi:hypothetical protein